MKRCSSGDSLGRWKRIIVDDSDSSSSSSSIEDLFDRKLCSYNPYKTYHSQTPRFSDSTLSSSPNSTSSLVMDLETSARAGPSGITSTSRLSNDAYFDEEITSISIRASTSTQSSFISESRNCESIGLSRHRSTYGLPTSAAIRAHQSSPNRESESNQSENPAIITRSSPTPFSDSESLRLSKELSQLHSRLLSQIECPVCLEPIVPPIHQCRRGHLVCFRCKLQLNQCPTCRDKMSDMRNWAVERLAEQFRYPCKNSSLGCQVTTLLGQKTQHEFNCSYRTYHCLFRTCAWSGFQPLIRSHLKECHSSRFLEGAQQCIDVELNSPTLFYIDWAVSCLGQIFRINVFQNIPNSILYSSVYLIGALDASSTDFVYTITVSGPNCRRISYTRETHTETSKMSSLCAAGDCFQMKGDSTKFFSSADCKLRLHVELQRCRSSSSNAN